MTKAQELLGAWQKKLSELEDMKARGDLTRDWGECSLINARTIVEGLTVIAAEADATIQPQQMREALESARDYIASVNFYAAGTTAYIKTCEQLIAIDAALAHTRPELSPAEKIEDGQ